MTNEIYLFKTRLTPERNALIDELDDYLDTCDSMSATVIYQKIDLDFAVKLEMSQDYLPNIGYNYAKIIQDNQSYYFFILDATWTSSKCVTLSLSIDSINTFNGRLIWNDKTHITRQHKDRFVQKTMVSGNNTLTWKIDKTSEGIQPIKLRESSAQTIYDSGLGDSSKWYLIYKSVKDASQEEVVGSPEPIQCYLTSNFTYTINAATTTAIPYPTSSRPVVITFADSTAGSSVTLNGHTFTFNTLVSTNRPYAIVLYTSGSAYYYQVIMASVNGGQISIQPGITAGDYGTYTTISTSGSIGFRYSNRAYNSSLTDNFIRIMADTSDTLGIVGSAATWKTINTVDKTDSRLVKIIELPYPPVHFTKTSGKLNVPNGWTYDGAVGMFRLTNLNLSFENTINTFVINNTSIINKSGDMYHKNNDINLETKLKHSDFWNGKLVYDSNSKDINLEDVGYNEYASNISCNIKFKPTSTINSKFLFKITTTPPMQEYGDYDEYIAVDRNNEVTLYNDEFINYLRSGINYDRKAQAWQIGTSVLGTVGTAAAAVGAIAAAVPTGGISLVAGISLASGAVTSAVNTVNTAIASERNIRQKKEQAALQATAISGANDVDLLDEYCGNKMQYFTYGILDKTKKAVYNMLRLTGYTDDVYEVPDFDSRIWYNFVQCTPDFDNEDVIAKKFVDDYKARFTAGVTVYHRNGGEIDFEQEYENFETWIVE